MFDVVLAVETYFCFEAYVLNHKIEVYYALIPLLTQRYDLFNDSQGRTADARHLFI